jgi:hypothetical protein
LIINYSFGHRNSTVLLTPYGGMVNYINHQKQRANVKVRWPNGEKVAHKPSWLTEKTPESLKHTIEKIGLSFEYVALRDIEEGEEVFMVRAMSFCDAVDPILVCVASFVGSAIIMWTTRTNTHTGLWRRMASGVGGARS